MPHLVNRYHDFSAGHRVTGHEGKCANLHGHNYRVHFQCAGKTLDAVGRVLDFSVINARLCNWLEVNWDHRMLIWDREKALLEVLHHFDPTVVPVPFNPTAENMAEHLVRVVGPEQLAGTGVTLVGVMVEETRKCSASFDLGAA